jgi:release factor glutamine methyltransferase
MNVNQLQRFGYLQLKDKVFNPELEVDLLLSHVLKKDRTWLYSNSRKTIPASKVSIFKNLIHRRLKLEPFAYLVGEKEFFGLTFKITKDVLIPRYDTEVLVRNALFVIRNSKLAFRSVIDIGTGSGAIIISLAKASEKNTKTLSAQAVNPKFLGTDISEKALRIAKQNAKRLKVKNIQFSKSNLLTSMNRFVHKKLDIQEKMDTRPMLVIANLPYLTDTELKRTELKYEPKIALSGGKSGLELIQKLITQFAKIAVPGDVLMLEAGFLHKKPILKFARGFKNLQATTFADDSGVERFVKLLAV